jgi:hypothetical protein
MNFKIGIALFITLAISNCTYAQENQMIFIKNVLNL